jgi:hypothetical protein
LVKFLLGYCSREKDQKKKTVGLSSDKVAGRWGWHSREVKPEESERGEGHITLGRGKVT